MAPPTTSTAALDLIWTIQLLGVDINMPLHELALELSSFCCSIISIARKADYENSRLTDIVFVQMVNEKEFLHITRQTSLTIKNATIRVEKAHCLINSAVPFDFSVNDAAALRQNGAPLSLHFTGLSRSKVQETFVFTLRAIAQLFEKTAKVTGVRLTYDVRKHQLLPYGFITFLLPAHLEEFHHTQMPLKEEVILKCEMGQQAQLLMSANDLALLNKGAWCEEIRRANVLCETPLVVMQPTVVINVPPTMPPLQSIRRPMKRRTPVEIEDDSPLANKTPANTSSSQATTAKKIIILSVEKIPPVEREPPTLPIVQTVKEEEDVLELGLDRYGRTLSEVISDLYGSDTQ